jgi:hypothetical protein
LGGLVGLKDGSSGCVGGDTGLGTVTGALEAGLLLRGLLFNGVGDATLNSTATHDLLSFFVRC